MIEPSKGRSRPRTRRSELERLVDRTVLEPTHPQLGTCWRFTGTTTPYGRIAKAQDSYTHRLGWKLLRGPIPEGKELHHRCGVYACWNPDHLELVTHAENQRHLRKAQCSQGHPLSGSQPSNQPKRDTSLSSLQRSEPAGVPGAPARPLGRNIRSRTVWGSWASRVAVVRGGPNRRLPEPPYQSPIGFVMLTTALRPLPRPSRWVLGGLRTSDIQGL
jgi:HNH endonuclease